MTPWSRRHRAPHDDLRQTQTLPTPPHSVLRSAEKRTVPVSSGPVQETQLFGLTSRVWRSLGTPHRNGDIQVVTRSNTQQRGCIDEVIGVLQ